MEIICNFENHKIIANMGKKISILELIDNEWKEKYNISIIDNYKPNAYYIHPAMVSKIAYIKWRLRYWHRIIKIIMYKTKKRFKLF